MLVKVLNEISVDSSNYSLGCVATWDKDKVVIHSACLSESKQVSNKVIGLSDGLTKQLRLQEEPEYDLKSNYQRSLISHIRACNNKLSQRLIPRKNQN